MMKQAIWLKIAKASEVLMLGSFMGSIGVMPVSGLVVAIPMMTFSCVMLAVWIVASLQAEVA